jgi:hypothetical protein
MIVLVSGDVTNWLICFLELDVWAVERSESRQINVKLTDNHCTHYLVAEANHPTQCSGETLSCWLLE